MEKKPLYHFLPGTRVLSFGTHGCNLACSFCQNWSLSRDRPSVFRRWTTPKRIVQAALDHGCESVAFTYNDPVVFAEFAIDTAIACREAGLRTVAVTSGFISGTAREDFFRVMDAANVDLKAFSESFYRDFCGASLEPVLETLLYLAQEASLWLELTHLVIPGANDDPGETRRMTAWIAESLGQDVPIHFSAFHPDHRLLDRPSTPLATLHGARAIARGEGLRHTYIGNIQDAEGSTTCCHACGHPVINRDGFRVTTNHLQTGCCPACQTPVAGVW